MLPKYIELELQGKKMLKYPNLWGVDGRPRGFGNAGS